MQQNTQLNRQEIQAQAKHNTAKIKECESMLFDLQQAINYFQELSNCLTLKL